MERYRKVHDRTNRQFGQLQGEQQQNDDVKEG